jgi:hypothetical protein
MALPGNKELRSVWRAPCVGADVGEVPVFSQTHSHYSSNAGFREPLDTSLDMPVTLGL